MFAFNAQTCDFVAGSVMSIRNYFRPSNRLSEPTVCTRVALKGREQGTLSLPRMRQVSWIFPAPCYCTFYSSYLPIAKTANTAHPRCLSRQMSYDSSSFTAQRIDRKRFRALFCTPMTLRPSPPILLIYVVASNTTFPSSMAVTFSVCFSPCSSYAITNAML